MEPGAKRYKTTEGESLSWPPDDEPPNPPLETPESPSTLSNSVPPISMAPPSDPIFGRPHGERVLTPQERLGSQLLAQLSSSYSQKTQQEATEQASQQLRQQAEVKLTSSVSSSPPSLTSLSPPSPLKKPPTVVHVDEKETVESLKIVIEKKDVVIKDLTKKLDDANKRIKNQMETIQSYQTKVADVPQSIASPNESGNSSPEMKPSPSEMFSEGIDEGNHKIQLQILQHPPTQAVYQRILRPFPTVAVVGVSNLKTCNNLFVEVSLLKQDEFNLGTYPARYTSVESTKNGAPLAGEKKHLIGGQLVQRSEAGSNPDTLIVVFRKLKVLTTTAQQGGAFFVLKFILKRYVDNNFEVVPGVTMAISDPMEVFSHTLYLKGRGPTTVSPPLPISSPGKRESSERDGHETIYHSNSNDSFLVSREEAKIASLTGKPPVLSGKAAAATLAMVKPRSRSSSANSGTPMMGSNLSHFSSLLRDPSTYSEVPESISSTVLSTVLPPSSLKLISGRSAITKSKEDGLQGLFQLAGGEMQSDEALESQTKVLQSMRGQRD